MQRHSKDFEIHFRLNRVTLAHFIQVFCLKKYDGCHKFFVEKTAKNSHNTTIFKYHGSVDAAGKLAKKVPRSGNSTFEAILVWGELHLPSPPSMMAINDF